MSTADPQSQKPSLIRRTWGFLLELLDVLIRPSTVFGLGVLVLAGFAAGVIFWGGFNTALELTNTEKFCTGCHEMRDNVFAELKSTIHFSNRSGVRASCPDCHVPHNWTDKIARKMQASKEVWGHLFGSIDTQDKFGERRLELALHEWARFKANDPWSAGTATAPNRWTSPNNRHVPLWLTSVSSLPAKRLASIVTRESPITCPTCAGFRAGSEWREHAGGVIQNVLHSI
jgi:cytochrome c-type protein NapC